jgi:hypothetical protein
MLWKSSQARQNSTEHNLNTDLDTAGTAVSHTADPIDTSDWKPRKEFTDDIFNSTGTPDIELFSDESGDNAVLASDTATRFTRSKSCFNVSWSGLFSWGHPPYISSVISSMFKKGLDDFSKDPINTKLLFMVPYRPEADWWPLTRFFKEVAKFPKGTEMFTIPKSKAFASMKNVNPDSDGRICIGPTRFSVLVFFKTLSHGHNVDSNYLAHLRYAHTGDPVLNTLATGAAATGLTLNKAVTSIHSKLCSVCNETKLVRPHMGATNRVGSTKPWELVFSDIHGPITPVSHVLKSFGTFYILQTILPGIHVCTS